MAIYYLPQWQPRSLWACPRQIQRARTTFTLEKQSPSSSRAMPAEATIFTLACLRATFPKYIPGHPSIIVQDEPGGGGLRASQLLYSVVEKDGTKFANLRASNMLTIQS